MTPLFKGTEQESLEELCRKVQPKVAWTHGLHLVTDNISIITMLISKTQDKLGVSFHAPTFFFKRSTLFPSL